MHSLSIDLFWCRATVACRQGQDNPAVALLLERDAVACGDDPNPLVIVSTTARSLPEVTARVNQKNQSPRDVVEIGGFSGSLPWGCLSP